MKIDYRKLIENIFTDEEIFSIAFDTINGYHTNPLRDDKNPGCRFDYVNDKLVFRDFAWPDSPVGNKPIDAITFAKLYLKTNTSKELLEKLFELKREGKIKNIKNDLKGRTRKNNGSTDTRSEVYFNPVDWNDRNKAFWLAYGIKNFHVDRNKELRCIVFPFDKFSIKGKTYEEEGYAYVYEKCIKIYRPGKKPKFLGNCKENDIGGKFIDAPITILTKSLKDFEVLRKRFRNVNIIYFQNEGMLPDKDTVEKFFKGKKVIVTMDNDEAGKKAAEKYKEFIKLFTENIVVVFPDSNDWADAAKDGRESEFEKIKIVL